MPDRPARTRPYARVTGPVLLAALLTHSVSAGVQFTDVTATAGVDYLQHSPRDETECAQPVSCESQRMTGGAAVGDVDGDGYADIFVTRLDAPDILFRNLGDGSFKDFTAVAGLDGFDLQSNGAALGDLDNDGDLDLMIAVIGAGIAAGETLNNRNFLFINDGNGRFTEEAVVRGAAATSSSIRLSTSIAFGDYDRDGYLDIHTTEWSGQPPSNARLFLNVGADAPGTFIDTTATARVDLSDSWGFASTFVDLDNDGWQDLAVAADFGSSRLFWNNSDGTFTNGTANAGVGSDENGMGSTFGDLDNDGDLDWFVTSIHDENNTCDLEGCGWGHSGNRLFANQGARAFVDATDAFGVREGYWGWGSAFFDYDNDGHLDLVMTNGIDIPGTPIDDEFNNDPMRVWRNDGAGRMHEVSAQLGLTDTGSGKALLTFDYDRDGDLDLFIVNNGAGPRLYRNDAGNDNAWLRVRVAGSISNRQGIGARVLLWTEHDADPQLREIGVSSHFLAQGEYIAHFGVGGAAQIARVEVFFPASGILRTFENIPVRQELVVHEEVTGAQPSGVNDDSSRSAGLATGTILLLLTLVSAARLRSVARRHLCRHNRPGALNRRDRTSCKARSTR